MKHKVIFPESAKTALQASYQQFVIHHRAQRRAKQLAWALAAVGVVCGLAWSVPVWASMVPPPMQQATAASVLLAATAFAALGVLAGWRAWHSHQRLKNRTRATAEKRLGHWPLTAHGPHVQAHK